MWPMDAGPPEPKSSRPCLRACASTSVMVLMGAEGVAMTTQGAVPIIATWVKPATGSYGCFSSANGPMEMGVELLSISV